MQHDGKSDKYLIFDTTNCLPAGLDHKLSTLKHAIKEAVKLDRVLVLRKFAISHHHNLVHIQFPAAIKNKPEYKNIKFERYINIAKTKIYELENNGSIRRTEKPLRYMSERDFDLSTYTDNPEAILKTAGFVDEFPNHAPTPINEHILIMENNERITLQQNNQYKIIVRRTNHYSYDDGADRLLVSLYPSDEVEHLTDRVLKSMGTSLDSVKKRFFFYHKAPLQKEQNNYKIKFSQEYPLYYACLHVRGNDALRLISVLYGADQNNLSRILKHAVPKGSIIYLMSDIAEPHYFDFLNEDYIVYRYFDFPELKALVINKDRKKIDNAMLYSVEKNILQYSHIKVVRARKYPKLLYTNSLHTIPWWFKFVGLYKYLTTDIVKRDYFPKPHLLLRHIIKQLRSNPPRY